MTFCLGKLQKCALNKPRLPAGQVVGCLMAFVSSALSPDCLCLRPQECLPVVFEGVPSFASNQFKTPHTHVSTSGPVSLRTEYFFTPTPWPLSLLLRVPFAPCVGRKRPLASPRPRPSSHVKGPDSATGIQALLCLPHAQTKENDAMSQHGTIYQQRQQTLSSS